MTTQRVHRPTTVLRSLLLLALCLSVFSMCYTGSAEAAGSYNVYHYTLDDNEYYYVYQYSSELDETPTFIAGPWDVYTSTNWANGLRVTFFRSYNLRSNDQADVLSRYLVNYSTAPYKAGGWYTSSSTQYGYRESVTIVYLVEGLNPNHNYYNFEYLWDWNPFVNDYGTTLNFEYYYDGDQSANFPELWDNGCSAILNIYGSYGIKASFGMVFTEGSDQHIVRRCCIYETWN